MSISRTFILPSEEDSDILLGSRVRTRTPRGSDMRSVNPVNPKMLRLINRLSYDEIIQKHSLQALQEKKYIDKLQLCTLPIWRKIFPDVTEASLPKLEEIKNTLSARFYDPSYLKWMVCNFAGTYSAYVFPKETKLPKKVQKPITENVGNAIYDLVTLGEESADGFVWSSKYRGVKDLFLIKTGKAYKDLENTISTSNQIYHEWFIGAACLNNLRGEISNFMYVYGNYQCNLPDVEKREGKTVTTKFCRTSKQPVGNYVLIENIVGSGALWDYIPTASPDSIISILLQIFGALKLAYERYKFCHYDLHPGNILLRDTGKIVYVKLPGDYGHVATRFIPVIIDYGRCRVEVEGQVYGYYGEISLGLDPTEARPEYDLYKLLGFILRIADAAQNKDVFKKLHSLMYLFPFIFDRFAGKPQELAWFLKGEYSTLFRLNQVDIFKTKADPRWMPTEEERSVIFDVFMSSLIEDIKFSQDSYYVPQGGDLPPGTAWNCEYGVCQ